MASKDEFIFIYDVFAIYECSESGLQTVSSCGYKTELRPSHHSAWFVYFAVVAVLGRPVRDSSRRLLRKVICG